MYGTPQESMSADKSPLIQKGCVNLVFTAGF